MERAQLERDAGQCPISTYAKSRIFGEARPSSARRTLSPDRVLLAQILGQLGASGLSASMADLAKAAASGSLHVDDLTASHLRSACDDIRNMHLTLMTALGMKVPEAWRRPESLRTTFTNSAVDWSER